MISAYSVHDETGLKMIPTLQGGVPRLLSEYVQSEPRLLSSNQLKKMLTHRPDMVEYWQCKTCSSKDCTPPLTNGLLKTPEPGTKYDCGSCLSSLMIVISYDLPEWHLIGHLP